MNIVYRFVENRDETAVFDRDKDHEMARKVAEESIVLLKNDGILPLSETDEIAFIGKFAKKPRFQGGGSSHINSHKIDSAMDMVAGMANITYAQGYDDAEDVIDEKMIAEAVEAAKKAKAAVIFAGLPDAFESEGFDRTHMRMPDCQNKLIEEVAKAQPNTVVVLHNGSPVEMPWVNDVKGIVEAYLGGQAVGGAIVDILFGRVNPSAKLAETFPLKLSDNPSYLYYIGEGDVVEYREGIFVGYRYYDKKNMDVLFPFGHGLSYTTFAYSNMKLDKEKMYDTDTLTVSVDVTNTGKMAGKEVVQLYVADKESTVIRPVKELKEFAKIELAPGETKTVTFSLSKRAFAYFNTDLHDWHVESGEFDILIGQSSRNIVCQKTVYVESTVEVFKKYHLNTTIGDIMKDPLAKPFLKDILDACIMNDVNTTEGEGLGAAAEEMQEAMMGYLPVRAVISFMDGTMTHEKLQSYIDQMNNCHTFTK